MNKCLRWLLVLGFMQGAWSVCGMAPRRFPTSLLVVPARHTVLQIANDVVAHRPVVLVSYQVSGEDDALSLHVWDPARSKWHPILLSDFRNATFTRQKPDRVVLVGSSPDLPTDPLPEALRSAAAWADELHVIKTLSTTPLLNELSDIFAFSKKEQAWFATRYQRGLVDIHAQQRRRSWYDQTLDEFLESEGKQSPADPEDVD